MRYRPIRNTPLNGGIHPPTRSLYYRASSRHGIKVTPLGCRMDVATSSLRVLGGLDAGSRNQGPARQSQPVHREGEELVVTDHGKAVARIVPIDRPGLLEPVVAEEVATPPLDRERTPLRRRITPTAPVSPLIVEDRR